MKDFWETTFICLAELTFALIFLFWYVVPDPVARWIMMLSNLAFTLIFAFRAYKLAKK
jgi:hypothetical protein